MEQTIIIDNNDEPCFCPREAFSSKEKVESMLCAFLYISLIVFPTIIESILLAQQTSENQIITLLICGIIQTILSINASFRWGFMSRNSEKYHEEDQSNEYFNKVWCKPITKYDSLFSTSHIVYLLPQWIVTNMISSWALVDHDIILPWYVHLLIYAPLIVFIIFFTIGFQVQGYSNNDTLVPEEKPNGSTDEISNGSTDKTN